PLAMPPHDGGRLNEHQRGPPSRPHGSESDPEQSISLTKTRSWDGTFEGGDLLPEGDILKHELVMPTTSDGKRATEQENQGQHAVDSVVPRRFESTDQRAR